MERNSAQDRLKKTPCPWYERSWSYQTGALALAALSLVYLALAGRPWGVTSAWAYWTGWVGQVLGADVGSWPYWQETGLTGSLSAPWLYHGTWSNLGLIWGALLSSLLASRGRLRLPRRWPVVLAGLAGGLLMGYGARLAMGCNIGALLGGLAAFSPHGWLFAAGFLAGSAVGAWLLQRFF